MVQVKKALLLNKAATELVAVALSKARTHRGTRHEMLQGMEKVKHARPGSSFGEMELMAPKPSMHTQQCRERRV